VFNVMSLMDHLGPTRTPMAQHLRQGTLEPPNLAIYHFGSSLTTPLACSHVTTLQWFACADHMIRP
jgi:hypothetical protein